MSVISAHLPTTQTQFDFRTGRETALTGPITGLAERAASTLLNRQRAKGLAEAARQAPSRQTFSPDEWAAHVAARAREWAVPLIRLDSMGIQRDHDGILFSRTMVPLKTGAEASPFMDPDWQVVYKLFPLHASGGLGKTFEIERLPEESGFEMTVRDAVLAETLEKLMLLHDAGAHPTEIVGIDDMGDYLVVKQPLAQPHEELEEDRQAAVERIRAVQCRARFRRNVWVLWMEENAWIVSDLHPGNIMREPDGSPCIIDALLAPLPPAMIRSDRYLEQAVAEARAWRLGLPRPSDDPFELVRDDDL